MKFIHTTLSLVLLVAAASCSGDKNTAAQQQVAALPVYTLTTKEAHTYQEFPVKLEGRTDIELRPQVDGYLQAIYVDEGAFVKAGSPLFKIEDHRYREALNLALGSLNAAEAAMTNAQLEVEKLTPLVDGKVISAYQLKSAKAALKIAEGNKKQAEATVSSAKINLEFTLIKAPADGYITRLPKKQGSLVAASDPLPLTTLSDNAEIYAYFSIGEADFMQLGTQYPGATINEKLKKLPPLTLMLPDGTEYAAKGQINVVDGQFSKNTGAITLRASFPNTSGLLRSGNTGNVRLDFTHAKALLVPQASTMEMQDKIFVYTVDSDNKVLRTPITILGKSGSDYLIKEGLKPGDRIVYKGFEALKDGAVITPEKISPELAKN